MNIPREVLEQIQAALEAANVSPALNADFGVALKVAVATGALRAYMKPLKEAA
jgi:hypothetical protein